MVYGLFTSKFKPRKKTDKMAGEAPLPPQACLPQAGRGGSKKNSYWLLSYWLLVFLSVSTIKQLDT